MQGCGYFWIFPTPKLFCGVSLALSETTAPSDAVGGIE